MFNLIGIPIIIAVVLVLIVHLAYKSSSIRDFFYKHAWKIGAVGLIGGAILRFAAP